MDAGYYIERAYSFLCASVHEVKVQLDKIINEVINVDGTDYQYEGFDKITVNVLDLTHIIIVAVVGYHAVSTLNEREPKEFESEEPIPVEFGTTVRAVGR